MLTVIIPTLNSEKPLAHTLSALVPAVVDGLLRRVVVIDGGSGDDTRLVAEGAGCAFYESAEIKAALDKLAMPWVLLLRPGVIPEQGWEDAVRHHMETGKGAARFTQSSDARLMGRIFGTRPTLDAGLLLKVDALRPLIEAGLSWDDLPARLKPVRLPHRIAIN